VASRAGSRSWAGNIIDVILRAVRIDWSLIVPCILRCHVHQIAIDVTGFVVRTNLVTETARGAGAVTGAGLGVVDD